MYLIIHHGWKKYIYLSEMAENVSNHPPGLEKIEIYLSEKAENVSDHPPWLEKSLRFFVRK